MTTTHAPAPDELHDTDVLIIGGGPAGLALAVELGMQKIPCILAERHDRIGLAPRAKTCNVRTRELFRRWEIADRLAALAPFGVNFPSNVVFATRLGGFELHRFSNAFNCSPARDDRFCEHAQWIPQYKVEAVLKEKASEQTSVEISLGTELVDFVDHGTHVVATVRHVQTGQCRHIRAKYIVGADGARSTVREKLGIKMHGVSPLSQNHNIIFRAPGLAHRHQLGPAVMYWLLNEEVPSVVAPLDANDLWTFGCPKLAEGSFEPEALIRKALGFSCEIEILSRDQWTAHQLIAERYSQGRAFLIGDACHLHPPFGGYGMNMGIGDALDLGWKLSAILSGWGGANLLSSYEIERRQVHQRVVDEAVANHAFTSKQLVVAHIEENSPAGEQTRAAVGAKIAETKHREFHSLGVVLGARYRHSPVLAFDPLAQPDPGDAGDYTPLAWPGCLAPHAWLSTGTEKGASLYDLFATDGLTLLQTHAGDDPMRESFLAAAKALGIPVRLVAPQNLQLQSLYGCRYALIRPDQYIAWCGNDLSAAQDALTLICGASTQGVA